MTRRCLLTVPLFALMVLTRPADGQAGSRLQLQYRDGRFTAADAAPITGSVNRSAIPNDYLEVTVARGTIHVEGGASDRVDWSLATRDVSPKLDSLAVRRMLEAGNLAAFGTSTWRDRFTIDLRVDQLAKRRSQADVQLRVPRDLKLLHVTIHGEGDVVVDNFAGELSVTSDSGSITGTSLSGPVLFEARNGGIDLDLAKTPFQAGPVNLLSHNGSIALALPARPSVTLDLNTNCGNIELGFPATDARIVPDAATTPGAATQDLDCMMRPKSLPPLPGVVHLHNSAHMMLGDGALKIRGMALQGDIQVSEKGVKQQTAQPEAPAAGPTGTAYIKIANGPYNGTYQLIVPASGRCLVAAGAAGRFRLEMPGDLTDGRPAVLVLEKADSLKGGSNTTGTLMFGPPGATSPMLSWDRRKARQGDFKFDDSGTSIRASFSGEPNPDTTWIGGTLTCNRVRRGS